MAGARGSMRAGRAWGHEQLRPMVSRLGTRRRPSPTPPPSMPHLRHLLCLIICVPRSDGHDESALLPPLPPATQLPEQPGRGQAACASQQQAGWQPGHASHPRCRLDPCAWAACGARCCCTGASCHCRSMRSGLPLWLDTRASAWRSLASSLAGSGKWVGGWFGAHASELEECNWLECGSQ